MNLMVDYYLNHYFIVILSHQLSFEIHCQMFLVLFGVIYRYHLADYFIMEIEVKDYSYYSSFKAYFGHLIDY